MRNVLVILFIFYIFTGYSQVGIGTTTPDTNAVLDIDSNSKGVLFPRLTDVQRDAIVNPAEGLYIYNLDNHRFEYFNGTFWMALEAIRIDTPDLFISEYAEPSSGNDKYIEIYNPNSYAVTLTGNYSIYMSFNGGSSTNSIDFIGTITAGDVFVFYSSGASSTVVNEGDQSSVLSLFNGNDAVQLRKSGIAIDQIGVLGIDPGNGWDVAGISEATENHVLQRKSTVSIGNTDWLSSAGTDATDSEWIVLNDGDNSGVGSHP
ncbi:MAG: lamin tail domain-containing protein [Flavobacteriaceae bacterium]